MPKVSVIIPLYNAGPHLKNCLDSIRHQTLNDFEVIIVSDTPTDNSDVVAKEYCEQDSRFLFFSNEQNLHIGNSRNRGITLAHGEYVTFSDHDDMHANNWLEMMYLQAQAAQADMVIALPHTDLPHDETNITAFPNEANNDIQHYIVRDLLTNGCETGRNNSLFNLVIGNFYRTDFLRSNNIQFVDTRTITPEDHIFQLQASLCTIHITLVNEILYFHKSHSNNEGNSDSYFNIQKRIRGLEYVEKLVSNRSTTNDLDTWFCQGAALQLILLLANNLRRKPSQALTTIREIKLNRICKKVIPFAPKSSKGLPQRIFRHILTQLLR